MGNNKLIKYTSEEILQIIVDFYNFQSEYCLEIGNEEKLNFQTTIAEWRITCELEEPTKLAKAYHEFFDLKTDLNDLIDILNKKENTLKVFCDYIAQYAIKVEVNPIKLLGEKCHEAAIFKTLKNELEKKGINTKDFKPSTEFAPFFEKHASELTEIISKLAPGSLSYYKFKVKVIGKLEAYIFFVSMVFLIIASITHKFEWYLYTPFVMFILLFFINNKFKTTKDDISGYHTIRDLIIGMGKKMESIN